MWRILGIIILLAAVIEAKDVPCDAVEKEAGFVCVCNATYCDTVEAPAKLERRQFHIYTTSNGRPGFNHRIGSFRMRGSSLVGIRLEVNDSAKRQSVLGFGGAFTDSFGYVAESLSNETRDHLLKSYFSPDGVEYTFCRVVFGCSDFALRPYNYAPKYDPSLKSFKLTEDDYKYKISQISRALRMSGRKLNLMSSIWSAPAWMKKSGRAGVDYLLPKFRQTWADYQIKTLEAYRASGIEFWGVTPINQPIMYIGIKNVPAESVVMFPEDQRAWIAKNLGPGLERAGFENVTVIICDDMRKFSLWYMDTVMRSEEAGRYTGGVGVHWYMDSFVSPELLDIVHERHPDKGIYYTESSINPFIGMMIDMQNNSGLIFVNETPVFHVVPPLLGSWPRAALYISNIIENLKHWVTGYMDWNMALDVEGGPNLMNLTCDAPLIVNTSSDEFYKQPMFYAMGHFSKFLQPGAVILDSDVKAPPDATSAPPPARPSVLFQYTDVKYVAALNPDGSHAVIIYNPKQTAMEVSVYDKTRGYGFVALEPESITTVVY